MPDSFLDQPLRTQLLEFIRAPAAVPVRWQAGLRKNLQFSFRQLKTKAAMLHGKIAAAQVYQLLQNSQGFALSCVEDAMPLTMPAPTQTINLKANVQD